MSGSAVSVESAYPFPSTSAPPPTHTPSVSLIYKIFISFEHHPTLEAGHYNPSMLQKRKLGQMTGHGLGHTASKGN